MNWSTPNLTERMAAMGILGFLASLCVCPMLSAQAAPEPFLKTSGLDIRNGYGSGDVVPLRGVNLGSWLLMEPWMCPMDESGLEDDWSVRETLSTRFGAATRDQLLSAYQDAWLQGSDFDRIAALGMNVVRLPFWYLNLESEDGTWRSDAFERLDWAVNQAWQRGIYTILDLHGAPGGQRALADTTGRKWPTAELWSNSDYYHRTLEIWRRVSEHYRGNPAVAGYDLLNEPMDTPSSAVYWKLLDDLYDVIRANDPDHILIMEATYGNWNFEMLPDPAAMGWSNVVYHLHVYPWNDWNDVAALEQLANNTVQDWLDHRDWNVPCHIGEFNMGPEAGWAHAIETYSGSGASWQMWAYKSTFTGGETSWGIYNPHGGVNATPNIATDSAASISNQWSQWTTSNAFTLNPKHRRTLSMPVAVDDSYVAASGPTLAVAAPGVLGNDTHLNLGGAGIQLQARRAPDAIQGTVTLNADGSFVYTAPPGFSGVDVFRYTVWDGRIDSVRVAEVSVEATATEPGPVTQLLWAIQPGGATNGMPLAQQPVLMTADAYGNPSTNALAEVLDIHLALSAGTGVLSGSTTQNLGTAGSNGMVRFNDLQVDGVGTNHTLTASVISAATPTNLLRNGDFNTPDSTDDPVDWTLWRFGPDSVWSAHEIPAKLQPSHPTYWPDGAGVYDGSYQMTFGGNGDARGAGGFQIVPVTPGRAYTLTVDAGAENWWLPTGEIRIIWLDTDGSSELARATAHTTGSIHDPDRYDVGVPYQSWSLSAVAPPGTSLAKIEFANPVGMGSAWFDNAEFQLSPGIPLLQAATSTVFTVHATPPPLDSIANTGTGLLRIDLMGGTSGTEYWIQTTTDLASSLPWARLPGSNQILDPEGDGWSFVISNSASSLRFYRAAFEDM